VIKLPLFVFLFSLITFKILNSIVLLGKAHDYIEENKRKMAANMAAANVAASKHSSNEMVPDVKPMSKDDLELLPQKSSLLQTSETDPSFRRTQSLVELNSDPDIIPETIGSVADPPDCLGITRQVSFNAGQLMFNSSVCLETLGLNDEEYVQDVSNGGGVHSMSADSPSKERKTDAAAQADVSPAVVQPLSEVDRYTMCSNSIVN